MSNLTKIIKILDPQAGRLQETILEEKPQAENLFESRFGSRRTTLMEAATTDEFPVLLRDGIRAIAYDRYMAQPTTWQRIADFAQSDKQSEDWVEENQIGEMPVVPEGTAFPAIKQDLDRTLNIRNYKRGFIFEITEELIRFNRTALVKRQSGQYGRSAANTREQSVYSVLTNTGNYTRNSTNGDNDIGANTAATTFSPTGLNTALATLRTMKDRKSGSYLGVMPNQLIIGPRLEMAAKQLLLSPSIMPVGDPGSAATLYGGGTTNPFRGVVNEIIVSPRLGTSYQWVLQEAKQAVILQEVEGFQIFQESAGQIQYEGWFMYDVVRYKVRDWFGVGMLNDRFAYYSSSTSTPVID